MYLLGQVKKNQAPDEVVHILKGDLFKFEKMTKTFNFVHDKNLETVEKVVSYKEQCYEKINKLKYIKTKLHSEKEEYIPAFNALKKMKVFEKPYQMYLKGYYEMQEEHDAYLIAQNALKTLEYETTDKIESLEKIKSNIEDRLSKKN